MTSRRGFLTAVSAAIGAFALDPERALWKPGAKLISIPAPRLDLPIRSLRIIRAFSPTFGGRGRAMSTRVDIIHDDVAGLNSAFTQAPQGVDFTLVRNLTIAQALAMTSEKLGPPFAEALQAVLNRDPPTRRTVYHTVATTS